GQLEDLDCDQEFAHLITAADSFDPQSLLQDAHLTADKALGFFIGAIRETFEETGIFLASDLSGHTICFSQKENIDRFANYRRRLNRSEITLKDIVRNEKLLFLPERLIPYSHWITPMIESKRFSARFFLAKLPEGQMPITDADELTESLWSTPKNLLEMNAGGKILLMPPTLKTIEELSAYNSIEELFGAALRRSIYPIMPQLVNKTFLLPHDPEYSIAQYKRPANLHTTSRLFLQDGRWKTAFFKDYQWVES
ncbi:MAG: hypothetical protein L7F78_24850, partial [Syntrophales bacterium LBB04]|nr:hypothetical protein [Syntrophales bacterium LBB04]